MAVNDFEARRTAARATRWGRLAGGEDDTGVDYAHQAQRAAAPQGRPPLGVLSCTAPAAAAGGAEAAVAAAGVATAVGAWKVRTSSRHHRGMGEERPPLSEERGLTIGDAVVEDREDLMAQAHECAVAAEKALRDAHANLEEADREAKAFAADLEARLSRREAQVGELKYKLKEAENAKLSAEARAEAAEALAAAAASKAKGKTDGASEALATELQAKLDESEDLRAAAEARAKVAEAALEVAEARAAEEKTELEIRLGEVEVRADKAEKALEVAVEDHAASADSQKDSEAVANMLGKLTAHKALVAAAELRAVKAEEAAERAAEKALADAAKATAAQVEEALGAAVEKAMEDISELESMLAEANSKREQAETELVQSTASRDALVADLESRVAAAEDQVASREKQLARDYLCLLLDAQKSVEEAAALAKDCKKQLGESGELRAVVWPEPKPKADVALPEPPTASRKDDELSLVGLTGLM